VANATLCPSWTVQGSLVTVLSSGRRIVRVEGACCSLCGVNDIMLLAVGDAPPIYAVLQGSGDEHTDHQ